jgi:hypothetical protein
MLFLEKKLKSYKLKMKDNENDNYFYISDNERIIGFEKTKCTDTCIS